MIVQGELQRLEQKMEHSKQAIIIMFSGNRVGTYLPLMVAHRAKKMSISIWTENGPAGTVPHMKQLKMGV